MDKQKYLEKYFNDLRDIINFDSKKIKNLIAFSDILLKTNNLGKKTIIFGNGGSAAIANHATTDLNKLRIDDNCLSAISLSTNIPSLLAIGNDDGFKNIFIEQLKNYKPQKEDILIVRSKVAVESQPTELSSE